MPRLPKSPDRRSDTVLEKLVARIDKRSAGAPALDTVATGVGTPVVALFGPTVEPFGFFPYSQAATVLQLPLSCRPCSSQGSARCPLGHHRCLREILPGSVHQAVRLSLR